MKNLVASLLLLVTTLTSWAGSIKGKVVDTTKQPLEFVNVTIYNGESLVKGSITDQSGDYIIDHVKNGSYRVVISFMGYKSVTKNISISSQQPNVNMGSIVLSEDSEQLSEVNVVAQKSSMKLDIDKKVFNVDQSISAVGGSASDVLENIPSVEVDAEGNVSLRGSSSVTIWINGKAQGMTSDNRGDILQQLPSESIDHIEVISNPSSKYSAEGSAGIINIVLKRDRKAGYYGGVQANASTTGGFRLGANINYSSGILDAYANIGVGRRKHIGGGYTNRDNIDADGNAMSFLNSTNENEHKGLNVFGRAGLTWHVTQHDEVSLGFMGMSGGGKGEQDYKYVSADYDGYDMLGYSMTRDRRNDSDNDMKMTNLELGYRHEWSMGHDIDFMVSKNIWKMDGDNTFAQTSFFTYKGNADVDVVWSMQKQKNDINNGSWEVQLDYKQPLNELMKIETGYRGNFSHENTPTETYGASSDKNSDLELTENDLALNESLYNRFIYDSDVHALYFNFQQAINEKFGYQVGLRGEGWTVDTESRNYAADKLGTDVPDKYSKSFFKLFPTAYLSLHIDESQELQLNYTRRLHRPWGGQLNSFKNISDSTNISYGNPELLPTYSNSLEFNYIKTWDNHTLSMSAYYRPSSNVMQNISYMDNGIRYSTSENITKDLSSGLEVIGKNRLWGKLDLTTTVNFFYYKLKGGTFDYKLSDGHVYPIVVKGDDDFSWNAKMLASVMLPKEISFQATFSYDAPKVITQGRREASYNLDLGLRKTFFDRKLTLAVNGRDMLDSRKWRSKTSGTGFRQDSEGWRGGRRGFLQLSYNFGNMKSKRPTREMGEDEGGNAGGYQF